MILAIGGLAACAEESAPQPPPRVAVVRPAPPPSSQPAHHHAAPPVPERKPTPPEAAGGPSEAAGSPDNLAMAEPTPAAAAPPALIGLDQTAARRRFGTAAERLEEPPATVWRYRNGSCELDLYFYLDLRSGRMRTLHYAFKGDTDSPTGQQQCLRSLTVARGGG